MRVAISEGWGHPDHLPWTIGRLAERLQIHRRTLQLWVRGETLPHNSTLESVLSRWSLDAYDRRQLIRAWRTERQLPEPDGRQIVRKREFLTAVGAATLTPTSQIIEVSHVADRYERLRELLAADNPVDRDAALQLYGECTQAALQSPSRMNEMLASMVASHFSIITRHYNAVLSQSVASEAIRQADSSGYHVAQLWSRTAQALLYQDLHRHQDAVNTLSQVTQLEPEQGTMRVFALTVQAESIAHTKGEKAVSAILAQADEARSNVCQPDEFAGKMPFPLGQQYEHSASALLNAKDNLEAVRLAIKAVEALRREPRRGYYMRKAYLTIATASACQRQMDQAEAYALKAVECHTKTLSLTIRRRANNLAKSLPHISDRIAAIYA
ncbi:MAG: hypothetical protein KTR25_15585 [Myxococcales bacterium]|nr:hypothetical protein [Myxococcales bacterium]